jgi:Rrf2 family nitric oxide-sensitive transcriptional repressor
MYCAIHPGETVRIRDIAESFGISRAHLLKAVRQMGQLGYLSTQRGRSGGIQLGMAAEAISIGGVVRALEDQGEFVECFNAQTNTCPIAGVCKLTRLFRDGLEAFYRELDPVTLADIVADGSALANRLPLLQLP